MRSVTSALLIGLSACLPWSAMSADAPQPPAHGLTSSAPIAQRPAAGPARVAPDASSQALASTNVDGFGPSIKTSELAKLSGGTDTTSNTMTLNGTVSNNNDTDVMSGLNSIGGGSFAGSAGIPMVIQNSGDNVLIQNATIVNVQFKQ
jgi:hypothetical protein